MKTYVAFDLGGTNLKYAVIVDNGKILDKGHVKTPQSGLEELVELITSITNNYKTRFPIEGVAMSFPGAVNSKTGIIEGCSAVEYIHGPNILELISKATGMQVFIENDANSAALAELWLGNAKDNNDVIFIVIGSGIGGAIVKDRKIHYGNNLHGGEFGYMLMKKDPSGERYLNWSETGATIALIERVAKRKNIDASTLKGEEIFLGAKANDPDCLIELNDWYETLAIGIFNLQYIYDPEVIILGGAVSEQADLIVELNARINKLVQNDGYATVVPQIKKCLFNNDANLIGAVYNALSQR